MILICRMEKRRKFGYDDARFLDRKKLIKKSMHTNEFFRIEEKPK